MVPAPAARSKKHAGGRKHKRGLALGEAVACCAAEALAASLRLTGWPVSDRDVLALYELTADGPDEGASIEATLEAAAARGLGGRHPVDVHELKVHDSGLGHLQQPGELHALHLGELHGLDDVAVALLDRDVPDAFAEFDGHGSDVGRGDPALVLVHPLILGVDLPGSHALCDDGAAWWSWGQPFDPAVFPGAVIEEAWAVRWAP